MNRRRRLLKALWFDRTGWALYSKRLERGTLELPAADEATGQVEVDPAQLAIILEGMTRSEGPARAPQAPIPATASAVDNTDQQIQVTVGIDTAASTRDKEGMDTLPPAIQALVDELRADRAAQRRQPEMQSRLLEKLNDEVVQPDEDALAAADSWPATASRCASRSGRRRWRR